MLDFSMPLSRDAILARVDELQLFYHYFGVPDLSSGRAIKQSYRNPLRHDTRPGCNFRKTPSGRWYFYDWAIGESYDIFDCLQHHWQVGFAEVLQRLNDDLSLGLNNQQTTRYPERLALKTSNELQTYPERPSTKITAKSRNWNKKDLFYWGSFGLTQAHLAACRILPVQTVWINDWIYCHTLPNEPMYLYDLGDFRYKVYRPFSRDKWRSNDDGKNWQGNSQLDAGGRLVVITKSLKDVGTLSSMGIQAVAPPSETARLNGHAKDLAQRFDRVYVLYDSDQTGEDEARRVHYETGFERIHLAGSGAKDISDHYQGKGKEKTQELLMKAL